MRRLCLFVCGLVLFAAAAMCSEAKADNVGFMPHFFPHGGGGYGPGYYPGYNPYTYPGYNPYQYPQQYLAPKVGLTPTSAPVGFIPHMFPHPFFPHGGGGYGPGYNPYIFPGYNPFYPPTPMPVMPPMPAPMPVPFPTPVAPPVPVPMPVPVPAAEAGLVQQALALGISSIQIDEILKSGGLPALASYISTYRPTR